MVDVGDTRSAYTVRPCRADRGSIGLEMRSTAFDAASLARSSASSRAVRSGQRSINPSTLHKEADVFTRALPKQATRGDRRFAFTIGFLCCVVFPAFVTIIAPITALTLSWDGERIDASATRFVYIVIPYASTTLADVTAV